MIATLPTGWRGRILALGLALVALATVYLVVAAPLLDLYANRQLQIESRRALLLKLNAVAAELPNLRARLAALRGTTDTSKVTLEGASDAIASAGMQGNIEKLAAATGETIGSAEGLPAKEAGEYRRIGLRLVLNGPYESLVRLLARLETATPPLIIDNLQIHTLQRRPGPALPASADSVNASVEIYGFRPAQSGAQATDAPKP